MTRLLATRWLIVVGAVSLAVSLGACAGSSATGPGMMGGSSSAASGMMGGSSSPGSGGAGGFGTGMMGSAPSGYHLSRLTCSAPTPLPGTTVYVMVGDMGMTRMMGGVAPIGQHMMLRAVPAQVPAGQVSFVVGNMGWRTHELVVLPLAAGQHAGERVPGADGKVDETGSLGEASAPCSAGTGDGITAGSVGWTTVTLAPGRYELVCDLPNHYADGMRQEIVVT